MFNVLITETLVRDRCGELLDTAARVRAAARRSGLLRKGAPADHRAHHS